jgi:hypothetical protein
MTEMPQADDTDYEAMYISENFGIPFTTALKITQANAEKQTKAKKKRR